MAVMPVIFSPQLLLVPMTNSCFRGLACSKASPLASRNIWMGAWLLPKMLSATPEPTENVIPIFLASPLS